MSAAPAACGAGGVCGSCPVCQALAWLRSTRPDIAPGVEAVSAGVAAAIARLLAVATGVASGVTSWQAAATPPDGSAVPAPRRRVQHIEVGD